MISIGLNGRADSIVTEANTATAACSGALPVYGTPFMIALMEQAAFSSLEPHLAAGESTVILSIQRPVSLMKANWPPTTLALPGPTMAEVTPARRAISAKISDNSFSRPFQKEAR